METIAESGLISVVIPTSNEEQRISNLVTHLKSHAGNKDGFEIIVADHSEDETAKVALSLGVKVVRCTQKGRGVQMNQGVMACAGSIIYFLHCDSFPPKAWDSEIRSFIGKGFGAGCFRLKFDWDHWFLRFSGYFTRFQLLQFRGGDQSLYVLRDLFVEVKSYPEVLMEDIEIVKLLRKKTRFGIIPALIETSARRYKMKGVFYLQFHFAFLHLLRLLSFKQATQRDYYNRFVSLENKKVECQERRETLN